MVLTTDQMDSTNPDDRRKVVAMCEGCAEWHFYRRPDQQMNKKGEGQTCPHCGGTTFRDVISQRTFDPARAKKASVKWLKRKK